MKDARHGMFLVQDDRLVGLDETPYDSEDLLQRFLARYPEILAGHQIDPVVPRRWLLVDREVAIPDAPDATGRWALDHLFLDQDGIPTLVEVKRSTDTRIRREVVGQVLEYAANALAHLPAERIRLVFEAHCRASGREPAVALVETFGTEVDPEAYWAQVDENVRTRRLRLVFVADVIPPELARIIEYLNEQMRTTEVLAVELKQYRGEDLVTLVPRVIGLTAAAEPKKGSGRGVAWDWDRFAQALEQSSGSAAVQRARRIHDWVSSNARLWWGRGAVDGGFVAMYDDPVGTKHQLFEVWTYGVFEVHFQWLAAKGPFVDRELRAELRRRLTAIPGVVIPEDALERRPTFRLTAFRDDEAVDQLTQAYAWVIDQIRSQALRT